MNLIIDQGNTSTKVALFNASALIEKKIFTEESMLGIEKYITLNQSRINKCIHCSVIDKKINTYNIPTITVDHRTKTPIKNEYKTPLSLGNDRLSNAVGAWSINPNKNSLIIDIGTCIKYDIVEFSGKYLGGNISPGINMRYKSLNDYTAKLPRLEQRKFNFDYGTDTESSLRNGVEQGLKHEINGFIERYKHQFSGLTIFMTGGDAKFFDIEYKKPIFASQNLTLLGLNEILNYNAE